MYIIFSFNPQNTRCAGFVGARTFYILDFENTKSLLYFYKALGKIMARKYWQKKTVSVRRAFSGTDTAIWLIIT